MDPVLSEKSLDGEAHEWLVVMQEQAEVSAAYTMSDKHAKGEYVFRTLSQQAERSQTRARALLKASGAPFQSFWIFNGFWVKGDSALLRAMALLPEVARIEDNPVISLSLPAQHFTGAEDRALNPWGLAKIHADDVWAMGYEGSGIVVGGQDTGYEWEHPAIKAQYRGWNGSSVNHNYNWHDAIHALINGGSNSCGLNLTEPCDDHNHGTHTVGTMVGKAASDSIIGVAPEAKWMGCRNMEEGDGTPATYIECFQWFIAPTDLNNQNPNSAMAPHVINNSWSCPVSEGCNSSNYATMETVVNNVRAAGILVVVSAGNTGPNCSTINAPAAIYAGSFTVGATSSSDAIANFSSRGPVTVYGSLMKPDISAPGVGVASCVGNSNNPGTYSYASWSGTSMAGPHVAGAAALLMSARPDLIGQVDLLEDFLEGNAHPLYASAPFCGSDNGTSLPNNVFGHGRLDILATINQALLLPVEWVRFEGRQEDAAVRLEWETALERDCESYTVERSPDGRFWETLGVLDCTGPGAYAFLDRRPYPGQNLYRLRQRDFDGTDNLSKMIAVSFSGPADAWRLVAKPSESSLQYYFTGALADTPLVLDWYALDGRRLYSARVSGGGVLAVPYLPSGLYAITVSEPGGKVLHRQMVKW